MNIQKGVVVAQSKPRVGELSHACRIEVHGSGSAQAYLATFPRKIRH